MEIPEELDSAHQSSIKSEAATKNGDQVDSMAGRTSGRAPTGMGHTVQLQHSDDVLWGPLEPQSQNWSLGNPHKFSGSQLLMFIK